MSFDDRKNAFEQKFKMDEDFRFKVNSKAVHLFGLWAAAQLGVTGADAETYANDVVDSDFDEPGIQDVLRKVKKDFTAKGMDLDEKHLEKQFNVHLEEAKKLLAS